MTEAASRTCTKTGFRLLACSADIGIRIARRDYPPVSAPERTANTDQDKWNRFDVVGQTLYTAGDAKTAYAEVLSFFKRRLGAGDPLTADAAALGLSLEEFLEEVASEWAERDFMGIGALPAQWRHDRARLTIQHPANGWWVDVEHPDTITALEAGLENFLAGWGIPALTTAILRGEDRHVTTAVAGFLRRRELDDGSEARGIHFGSKHGGSWCRAIWLPDISYTLQTLASDPVLLTDEDLITAADRFRIRAF